MVAAAGYVIRRWRDIACAEAAMTSSSNYDIRRNLIDAPSSDSQLPVAGGSDLAVSGTGLEDRRTTPRGCSLRGVPRAMSQDSLSIRYRRFIQLFITFRLISQNRSLKLCRLQIHFLTYLPGL